MAGLTKQHFNKIAEIINFTMKDIILIDDDKIEVFNILVEKLAEYFKTQNPLFNENQFKKACLD